MKFVNCMYQYYIFEERKTWICISKSYIIVKKLANRLVQRNGSRFIQMSSGFGSFGYLCAFGCQSNLCTQVFSGHPGFPPASKLDQNHMLVVDTEWGYPFLILHFLFVCFCLYSFCFKSHVDSLVNIDIIFPEISFEQYYVRLPPMTMSNIQKQTKCFKRMKSKKIVFWHSVLLCSHILFYYVLILDSCNAIAVICN